MTNLNDLRVAVLAMDGVEEVEFTEPVRALKEAGAKLTGYYTIQDDIRNAGGNYLDQEVVVDDNLVTSRQPSDLPAFNREMIALFSRVPAHR